jgi:hypothetical protein
MGFGQCKKSTANSVTVCSQGNNYSDLDDFFFSGHEEAPWQQLSYAYDSEYMIEKGANINVVNVFQKSGEMPTPIKPTLESEDADHTIVINAQVNYDPTLFRALPATNREILDDTNAAELDMV